MKTPTELIGPSTSALSIADQELLKEKLFLVERTLHEAAGKPVSICFTECGAFFMNVPLHLAPALRVELESSGWEVTEFMKRFCWECDGEYPLQARLHWLVRPGFEYLMGKLEGAK